MQTIEEADLMQEQEPLMNGHNGNANNADSISMLTGSQQDSLSQLGLGTLGGLGSGPTTIGKIAWNKAVYTAASVACGWAGAV